MTDEELKQQQAAQQAQQQAAQQQQQQQAAESEGEERRCKYCGMAMEKDDVFCPACGEKAGGEERECHVCGKRTTKETCPNCSHRVIPLKCPKCGHETFQDLCENCHEILGAELKAKLEAPPKKAEPAPLSEAEIRAIEEIARAEPETPEFGEFEQRLEDRQILLEEKEYFEERERRIIEYFGADPFTVSLPDPKEEAFRMRAFAGLESVFIEKREAAIEAELEKLFPKIETPKGKSEAEIAEEKLAAQAEAKRAELEQKRAEMERRYKEILGQVSKEVKDFKDEEERKRLEEERRRMEEEKRRIEEERRRLEEEARKRAEEEARRAAEARRKAEEERRKAEAEQKRQEAERQKRIEAERRRLEAEAFARRFVGTFHAWMTVKKSKDNWEKIKIISEDNVIAWGQDDGENYTARYDLRRYGDKLKFTLTHIEGYPEHCGTLEGTINRKGTTIKGWWDNNSANDYATYYRCN